VTVTVTGRAPEEAVLGAGVSEEAGTGGCNKDDGDVVVPEPEPPAALEPPPPLLPPDAPAATGVTGFEPVEGGPVPALFAAVTVNE
jgi:hypothetical protein